LHNRGPWERPLEWMQTVSTFLRIQKYHADSSCHQTLKNSLKLIFFNLVCGGYFHLQWLAEGDKILSLERIVVVVQLNLLHYDSSYLIDSKYTFIDSSFSPWVEQCPYIALYILIRGGTWLWCKIPQIFDLFRISTFNMIVAATLILGRNLNVLIYFYLGKAVL
jgi:hypothetical protein